MKKFTLSEKHKKAIKDYALAVVAAAVTMGIALATDMAPQYAVVIGALAAPAAPTLPPMMSLNDMTQRPDEPLTAGLNIGEGPGSEVMNVPNRSQSLIDTIRYLTQFDPSGDAELIYRTLTDQGY
jgi:hypothetical protein